MNTRKTGAAPHVLHVYSGLGPAGEVRRLPDIVRGFGSRLRHSVVLAEDGADIGPRDFGKGIDLDLSPAFPSLVGRPLPGRLARIARAMQPYDLVLSYNYGALDAAMAATLFKDAFGLPPLIHFEDDLGDESFDRLRRSRTWYRRIALGKTAGLVVPLERLEEIALIDWQQPLGRVKHIPFPIDTKLQAMKTKPDALRLIKRPGERWIGAVADFDRTDSLPALVRAFAAIADPAWQLVILGEGAARQAIEAEADRLQINDRVHLPGPGRDPDRAIGLFDIFAQTSDEIPVPLALTKAMAAGLPVAAMRTPGIAGTLAPDNDELLGAPGNEDELAAMLCKLAADKALRERLGDANRRQAIEQFDPERITSTLARLFASAMRREI